MDVLHCRVRQEDWPSNQPISCSLYAARGSKGPGDDTPRPDVGGRCVFSPARGSLLDPLVDFRWDLSDQWPSRCVNLRSPEGFDGDAVQATRAVVELHA